MVDEAAIFVWFLKDISAEVFNISGICDADTEQYMEKPQAL